MESEKTKKAEIGSVPSDWFVGPLNHFTNRVTYGFTNPMPDANSGPFKITAKDINHGRILYETARRTTADAYADKLTDKSRPKVGDVLVTKDGSIGRVAVCDRSGICINQSVAVIQPNGEIDSQFLKHMLLAEHYQRVMVNDADGTTIKHIYITRVDKMEVAVPPLPEQQAIAHILGSLDDRIELNRRMNATLEGMAQALFKSWFVDFDPVIDNALVAGNPIPEELTARAELRRTALDNGTANRETAKQFPDAFVETEELGWIPESWEVSEIRERTKSIQYGLTRSATDDECGPHFLRITDIRGGSINWSSVPFCETTSEELEKYRVHNGDIFVARTGASTGENVYITRPVDAVFASYLVRFAFEERAIGRIVGVFMRSLQYFEHIAGILGGSAQPNASAQALASALMVFPSQNAAHVFWDNISPMDERRSANEAETRTLTKLRDTLLPKLISGELRIPDAEKIAEAALA